MALEISSANDAFQICVAKLRATAPCLGGSCWQRLIMPYEPLANMPVYLACLQNGQEFHGVFSP